MLNKKPLTFFSAITLLSLLPLSYLIADDASLVQEKCGACHGDDGNSLTGKVPSIAGFTATSLSDFLEEYKDGDRKAEKYTPKGGKESDMQEIASNLSEEDLSQELDANDLDNLNISDLDSLTSNAIKAAVGEEVIEEPKEEEIAVDEPEQEPSVDEPKDVDSDEIAEVAQDTQEPTDKEVKTSGGVQALQTLLKALSNEDVAASLEGMKINISITLGDN